MSGKLPIRTVEKVWGRDQLPAPFQAPEGKRIGEIWFEPPKELEDLLVKYLFTSEKLSVQVHPDDAQACELGDGNRGKEECWLVIGAEPGARLGIGFDETLEPGDLRASALDGSIEQKMTWHEVKPGDFFYIPAGTVHAIGPGVSLIEVQQNCDITYRLFDYGRPRELHLDRAEVVADAKPYPVSLKRHVPDDGGVVLVDGPHFRLVRSHGSAAMADGFCDAPVLVIPLDRGVVIAGEQIAAGECGWAASLEDVELSKEGRALLAQAV